MLFSYSKRDFLTPSDVKLLTYTCESDVFSCSQQPVPLITYSEYNYHDTLRVFSSLCNNTYEKHAA